MKFYWIKDDLYKPVDRWFLGAVNFDGEWEFWKYVSVGNVEVPNKHLSIDVRDAGTPIDFTFADFELLIVNEKTSKLFSSEDVQLIPLKIAGQNLNENYFLMTIRNDGDCVDESKSVFEKFEVNDPVRPDKARQYKVIYQLAIKNGFKSEHEIFRIKNYHSAIIVTETLRKSLVDNKTSGIKFLELG